MSSSTTRNATIRVLGPNGKITFEGEEVLIEEEAIPLLIGQKIFRVYRDIESDVGLLFLFENGTWFSFSFGGDEGKMVTGKVDQK